MKKSLKIQGWMAVSALLFSVALSMPELMAQSSHDEDKIEAKPGLATYRFKCRDEANEFFVYIPQSYDGFKKIPLIISAHGNGGSGKGEIAQWTRFADEHGWIIACPTFLTCSGKSSYQEEASMLEELMKRLLGSLEVDRDHVLFTGHSAGGNVAWYMASKMDKEFTALCFRSGNFMGEINGLDMKRWRDRPIYLFWGSNAPSFKADTVQGPAAVEYLEKEVRAKKVKHEIIQGGGHDSRPDLVAAWFLSVVQGTDL